MARPARPWWREQTGWWMVKINGKQTKLLQGPQDERHRLLAEEKFSELRRLSRVAPQTSTARTVDIIEAYLSWSRQNLSTETHRVNRFYCQLFAEHCGTIPAKDIKPFHVTTWINTMMSPERVQRQMAERAERLAAGASKRELGGLPKVWGLSTAHNGRTAAFRVFSWAKEQGLLPDNPLAGMKRPKPPSRQRAMSDDEYTKMHENAAPEFADFLLALRETGARPKELRDLVWTQVQDDRLVVKNKTEKSTQKARVIILSDAMKAVLERLKGNQHTHVFLNCEGQPWTMNAVRLQITRLRKRLGLAGDLCAYLARHGFGTRAIMNGVNPSVVAELMGHNSLEMVARVYVHLADEHEHLKAAVERVNASTTPSTAALNPTPKRAAQKRAGA